VDVLILNDVIASVLLVLPALSVTLIVQSEYVASLSEDKVIVLLPEIAVVVLEEHDPPYEIVPASSDEKI
tara:strand:+ start:33 stop:242 length:210 start_codon:yes stop_codon:yes gene_type:complete